MVRVKGMSVVDRLLQSTRISDNLKLLWMMLKKVVLRNRVRRLSRAAVLSPFSL